MSRKTDLSESSLELLLDTICNTFGGVLFISILVVILLNITSEDVQLTPPDPEAQSELKRLDRELATVQAKLESQQETLQGAMKTMHDVVDPDAKPLVEELDRAQTRNTTLQQLKSSLLGDIGDAQKRINEIATRDKQVKDALAAAQARLAEVEQKLKREIRTRSKTAKLPKVRQTTKTMLGVFLKKGRICTTFRAGAGGSAPDNPSEYQKTSDANGQYIEPKLSAGRVVHADSDRNAAIERRIKTVDSSKYFLKVFVWPDSFDEFLVVKDLVVRHGFEYNLVPMEADEKVTLGSSSGPEPVQ